MSTLTTVVDSQGQLLGQEQLQRQGQTENQKTAPLLSQIRSQRQTNNNPVNFNGLSGSEKRSERLLMTVRSNVETGSTCGGPSRVNNDLTERPLGRGAFGEVWSVVDPRSDERVALKRLANIFTNRQFAIRVFREVTCLTALQHENILAAIDILQLPTIDDFQDVFLLTQLMDSDLYRIIISNQPISVTHIKVFLYQVLRGLKYLHSGKIIHRDIKPANLLVNANCCLKICDFGLVRDDDVTSAMTQDVSTQYYRAPEMLMGAKYYTTSVDMWAAGCVFSELLSRRILFQANSPIQQLDLIMEIVGTPQLDDMKYACEAARKYILRQAPRKPDEQILHCLASPNFCSHDAVQLLRRLLVFNPEKRLTASKALQNNYIRQGRDCYHSTICSCHPPRPFHPRKTLASTSDDLSSCFPDSSNEFEPVIQFPFSFELHKRLEEDLESPPPLTTIRTELYRLCVEKQKDSNNPLRVNTKSPAYHQFIEDQPQMKN